MPIPDTPYTRKEAYLNAIATGNASGIPETPYTREEIYLDAIAKGGGGGGSSTLSGLTDVDISNPTDGQTLVYNATSGKWENGAGGGGGLLIVGVNYETGALDKTYREIANADMAVLKMSNEGISLLMYLASYDDLPAANSGAKASGGWTGHMRFVEVSGTIGGSVLPHAVFVTSDPDGYPVASNG